jgi:pro-apoptotic serine protease NMA111
VGLPSHIEAEVRKEIPQGVGMLAVSSLVPGGTGAEAGLEPGDVLVKLGGKTVTLFPELEEILDDSVGGEVEVEVIRGGEKKKLQLKVQDLHSITPASFIEMGDSVFHDLSYHMVRDIIPLFIYVYVEARRTANE